MAAPTGIERPKVNMAGTMPAAAPRRPPETRPVAAPPAPSVTAPPTAEAAVAWALRSTTTSRTPSPSSETFVFPYSKVSAADALAELMAARAAWTADPATFWDRIRSIIDTVPLPRVVCTTSSMPRTTSRRLSTEHLRRRSRREAPPCVSACASPSSPGCSGEAGVVGERFSAGGAGGGSLGCVGAGAVSGEAMRARSGRGLFHCLPRSRRCSGSGSSCERGRWNTSLRSKGSRPSRISLLCSSVRSMHTSMPTRRTLQA
mmetsp:Transcript_76640/g.228430  ORF Transcript_76640/g.228430 Transcript_76640/m.228430 type:complete len:260 (-) Transcript_76640:435-1214(-)